MKLGQTIVGALSPEALAEGEIVGVRWADNSGANGVHVLEVDWRLDDGERLTTRYPFPSPGGKLPTRVRIGDDDMRAPFLVGMRDQLFRALGVSTKATLAEIPLALVGKRARVVPGNTVSLAGRAVRTLLNTYRTSASGAHRVHAERPAPISVANPRADDVIEPRHDQDDDGAATDALHLTGAAGDALAPEPEPAPRITAADVAREAPREALLDAAPALEAPAVAVASTERRRLTAAELEAKGQVRARVSDVVGDLESFARGGVVQVEFETATGGCMRAPMACPDRSWLDRLAELTERAPLREAADLLGAELWGRFTERTFEPFDNVAMPDALRGKLEPRHYRMLAHGSRIADDVILARGYFTATKPAELKRLGFKGRQAALVPALVIPLCSIDGETFTHQLRPDDPPLDAKGKVAKYVAPKGYKPRLDIPAATRAVLRDQDAELWVTEGARKVDALASAGIHAVNIGSVSLWRVPCWNEITLKGRTVVLGFDSDVLTKLEVWRQLAELSRWADSKGASVRVLHLPHSEGGKCGVDDFLAARHTADELRALVRDTLPAKPLPKDTRASEGNYFVQSGRVAMLVPTGKGDEPREVELANFGAMLTEQVVELDDGQVTGRTYRVQVTRDDDERTVEVAAEQFERDPSGWVSRELGARFSIGTTPADRMHFAAAVRRCSAAAPGGVPERTIYTSPGFERIKGEWRWLHAGGAIGRDGNDSSVEVRLSGNLRHFALPEPDADADELRELWLGARDILKLVPGNSAVGFALLGLTFRAPLGHVSETLWVCGRSGSRKSSVVASCAQAFFGADFWNSDALPEGWLSTAPHIETMQNLTRDSVLTVDDFVLGDNPIEQNKKAVRVLRAQANAQPRGRMNGADMTAHKNRPPRGALISTSEHSPPPDEGIVGRCVILRIERGDVDDDVLTRCQQHAMAGRFAKLFACYVSDVAGNLDDLRTNVFEQIDKLRSGLRSKLGDTHARTPEAIANLQGGILSLAQWLKGRGAITSVEFDELCSTGGDALVKLGKLQAEARRAADPAHVFIGELASMLSSGRVHLEPRKGQVLSDETLHAIGWRERTGLAAGFEPRGDCVGVLAGDSVLLDPIAATNAVRLVMRQRGDSFPHGHAELGDRLLQAGFVQGSARRGSEAARGWQRRPTTERRVNGCVRSVWAVRAERLLGAQVGDADVKDLVDAGELAPEEIPKTSG